MTVSHKWLNVARRLQHLANSGGGGAAIIKISILVGGDNEPVLNSSGDPAIWICTKDSIEPKRTNLNGLDDDVLEMVVRGM
jgi:hypothetical protein